MAWQATYDAYGAVATAEELQVHPRLHAGHKGLFLDRLDVGVVSDGGGGGGGGSYVELPRLVPFGHSLCYNRNRAYAPGLGRFLQMDPNASAMVLAESERLHGRGSLALAAAFSLDAMYGDGYNLYEYLSSSPWGSRDPMGLAQDPFDMVDEFLAADAASKAAFINDLIGGIRAAAHLAATVASFLPFPGVSLAGELALAALEGRPLDDVLLQAALGAVPGGKLAMLFGDMSIMFSTLVSARGDEVVDDEMQAIISEFVGGASGGGPAKASKVGTLIKKALGLGMTLYDIFDQAMDGPPYDVYVYFARDPNNPSKVLYVGISNDVTRRSGEHGPKYKIKSTDVIGPYSRLQARAIETAAMTRFGSTGSTHIQSYYDNKSRSIGSRRAKFFQAALSWGARELSTKAPHMH